MVVYYLIWNHYSALVDKKWHSIFELPKKLYNPLKKYFIIIDSPALRSTVSLKHWCFSDIHSVRMSDSWKHFHIYAWGWGRESRIMGRLSDYMSNTTGKGQP